MPDDNKIKWKRIEGLENDAEEKRKLDLFFHKLLIEDTNIIENSLRLLAPSEITPSVEYGERMEEVRTVFRELYARINDYFSGKIHAIYAERNNLLQKINEDK